MDSALLSLSRLAGPEEGGQVVDARQSLAYWTRRADELPWHRRAERREARAMISTSRARLIGAHLEHLGLGTLARLLTPFLDTRGRSGGAHVRSLALTPLRRTAIGRRILVTLAAIAVAGAAMLAAAAAILAYIIF